MKRADADLVSTLLVLALTLLLTGALALWWAHLASAQPSEAEALEVHEPTSPDRALERGHDTPDPTVPRRLSPPSATTTPRSTSPTSPATSGMSLGSVPGAPGGVVVAALERALLAHATHPESGHVAPHCARAPGGCAARIGRIARAIVAECTRAGCDPWLIAAIATVESSLDSGAVGRAGELGLLQLHPAGPAARRALAACHEDRATITRRGAPRDPRSLERCRGIQLLRQGIWLLGWTIGRCGSREAGLAAYNAGRCDGGRSRRGLAYARRVLRQRDVLLAAGGGT